MRSPCLAIIVCWLTTRTTAAKYMRFKATPVTRCRQVIFGRSPCQGQLTVDLHPLLYRHAGLTQFGLGGRQAALQHGTQRNEIHHLSRSFHWSYQIQFEAVKINEWEREREYNPPQPITRFVARADDNARYWTITSDSNKTNVQQSRMLLSEYSQQQQQHVG